MPTTFNYTGAVQTFTVPPGLPGNLLGVDVRGGSGASANSLAIPGGAGLRVQCIIPVTPGEVLQLFVGQQGLFAAGGLRSPGGWNGGGDSGINLTSGSSAVNAGSGAGASDIRRGGTALTDRIIVAAGGGGAGGGLGSTGGGGVSANGQGGSGSTPTGVHGGAGDDIFFGPQADGGSGGTQLAGGAKGTFGVNADATDGALGVGGRGGSYTTPSGGQRGGGGAGGGYYGGGGGAAGIECGGGGGGSGFVIPAATAVTYGNTSGWVNGLIIIDAVELTRGISLGMIPLN